MYSLYWESKGSKGIALTKLARDAPAPIRTNKAGRAQHKRVDDVRNKVRKLIALLFISCSVYFNDTHTRSVLAIHKDPRLDFLEVNIGKPGEGNQDLPVA